MNDSLYALSEKIRKCTSCPLWKNRFLAVPGEGPLNSKILFVGEAPGAEEDKTGMPFVGVSGKFLINLLSELGINPKDLFFTSAVKCHPQKNRKPMSLELKTCYNLWLKKQIELINPDLVVLLGRCALESVLEKKSISEVHGKIIKKENRNYFVTYHPSAARRFPKIKKIMQNDFKKIKIN